MKPIFSWAGGKRRLLPVLRDIIGTKPIKDYYEPFLGGGALFFDIWEQARGVCFLNDVNRALIDAYKGIRNDSSAVIRRIQELQEVPYEQLKERFNYQEPNTPFDLKAARFIALNHCCFNGLWRVNKAGEFNVPVGRDSKGHTNSLSTLDLTELRNAQRVLRDAVITNEPLKIWETLQLIRPESGDLVFFDPPYLGTFDGYSVGGFGIDCHEHLISLAKRFAESGARVIVCASGCDLTYRVYGPPTINISLQRTIGASKRGEAKEVLYLY